MRGMLSTLVTGLAQTAATSGFTRHAAHVRGFERLFSGEMVARVRGTMT
jgi:hypothetical protein